MFNIKKIYLMKKKLFVVIIFDLKEKKFVVHIINIISFDSSIHFFL